MRCQKISHGINFASQQSHTFSRFLFSRKLIRLKYRKEPKRWGKFECLFFTIFALWVCRIASCWFLVLLAFARYHSIVKPFQKRLNKKTYCISVLMIWVASFGALSYWFLLLRYTDIGGCQREMSPNENTLFMTFCYFFSQLSYPLYLCGISSIKSKTN